MKRIAQNRQAEGSRAGALMPTSDQRAAALALLAERGELDGIDVRDAGVTPTAVAGMSLLSDLETAGVLMRGRRGWLLREGTAA